MEDLDLDAFIANIEESAPQEDIDETKHKCEECDTILENIEGDFICPNCSAQATNILQLEQSELHYDESGRAIVGQRVNLIKKKNKDVDYGWAWSTDEAIIHILNLQINALEKIGLVPDNFRQGVKNMWFKFWVEHIAPFIKDEYTEKDLIYIKATRALRMRDIEVLVKLKDKVMLPARLVSRLEGGRNAYTMMGTRFFTKKPNELKAEDISSSSDENSDPVDRSLLKTSEDADEYMDLEIKQELEEIACESADDNKTDISSSTFHGVVSETLPKKYIASKTITILTLNRTLAFIEATARCMNLADPLFASDIIRACNQRLIPFFGAHKTLPNNLKLDSKDRITFQKTRPPSPIQLTRAASQLVHKIYHDKLPLMMPVPDLNRVLERFIVDMNLPSDLINHIKGQVNFSNFKQTRPLQFHCRNKTILHFPQYDRWAFAILVCQMKRLFNFDDNSINEQRQEAREELNQQGEHIFMLHDWARQISMRLQFIVSYDPYMLFHPMTDISNLQPTPQVYNYVKAILSDRVVSSIRSQPSLLRFDETYRLELTEFIRREIPRPPQLNKDMPDESELDKPIDTRHPIHDAFNRTKRFWISEICQDKEVVDLLFKDFSDNKISTNESVKKWTIYDDGYPGKSKFEILPTWPYCFKLLLSVGGYLCYCEPKELLHQVRIVEEFLYPHMKVLRKNYTKVSNNTIN